MKDIFIDNDYEAEHDLTRKNTNTGEEEAAAGVGSLLFWISATAGGTALHANLSKSATERTGTPGRYFAQFSGDDLTTSLTVGNVVYLNFGDSSTVLTSKQCKVRGTRRPDA